LIPHAFGMKVPPILNSKKLLQNKLDMLEQLADLEIAAKIMETKNKGNFDVNPIDEQYKALNAELEPVDRSEDEFGILKDYVKNTHAATHNQYSLELLEVFKVKRKGQDETWKPWAKSENRQLLWHGSRLTNWVGILSQGLRIAPPEAPVTGYMFGKGVYFADMSSKSANYCHTSKQNPIGLLMLCEVALGNMLEKKQAEMIVKLPAGYQSCFGVGKNQPNPDEAHTMDDGCIVPLGKPVDIGPKDTALLYNEFIVYDTAQINVRYMLKLKFHYN